MKYSDENIVHKSDLVLIEKGKTSGKILDIIDNEKKMNEWKVEEHGLMIKSEPFGLVFWPKSEKEDPVIFVSRGR